MQKAALFCGLLFCFSTVEAQDLASNRGVELVRPDGYYPKYSPQKPTHERKAAVKTHLLNLAIGKFSLNGEVAVSPKNSVQLQASYWAWNRSVDIDNSNADARLRSLGFTPEFRTYLGAEAQALKGFYLAPYLNLSFINIEVDVDGGTPATTGFSRNRFTSYGGGITFGHQFLIKDRFALDLFLGLGGFGADVRRLSITYQDNTVEEADIPFPVVGVVPRFGIATGFAF